MTNYSWKGYDGTFYSKDSAEVRIQIISVNDPPIVVDFKINGSKDHIINFKKVGFTENFIDVENDQLEKIKITTLPSYGTLKLDGNPVKINEEIPLISLEKLRFEPDVNWFG